MPCRAMLIIGEMVPQQTSAAGIVPLSPSLPLHRGTNDDQQKKAMDIK